jgi:CO/xanthine dehydrogenase FAD-binding subunit
MKPAAFEYSRPGTLDEACELLVGDGDDVRIIAGGQTLVPLMAMRLARPKRLIDIARLEELAYVRDEGDAVAIGATTRQCALEQHRLVAAKVPLLAKALPFVGHAPIRARGTIGGSLANADPAAEIALVAVTLGAVLRYREGRTVRELPAADFFLGPMLTALPPAACLTAVCFPTWHQPRVGCAFHEINARKSDFAFAAAAAQIAIDEDGICRRAAVAIGAVTAVPLRLDSVAAAVVGTRLEDDAVRAAVAAGLAVLEPMADLHASAGYRRRAASVLAMRALGDAYRAAGGTHAG